MSDLMNAALLTLGLAFSAIFAPLVCFARRPLYAGWAKGCSVAASLAGIGWGSMGLFLSRPNVSVPVHVYYAMVHTQGILGGMCLGFALSILISRPYRKIDIHAAAAPFA
jgi:hypothetical protein